MSEYQEAIFICVVVGTVTILLPWLQKKYTFGRDSNRIISFIRDSKYTFRSTDAIAAGTKINPDRVEEICSRHKEIIQNKKTPDTWRVM